MRDRFWAKVDKSGDCWQYTGGLNKGYGQFWVNEEKRSLPAHVVAYRLAVDPDNTADLDHLCHTRDLTCRGGVTCPHRACVNPDHLEPVSRGENSARGKLRLTHCKFGHEYTPENTHIAPRGYRICQACARRNAAGWRARQRS